MGPLQVGILSPGTPGSWLAGRRLVAIDGTCLDLADTPANDEHSGGRGGGLGRVRPARDRRRGHRGVHNLRAGPVGAAAGLVGPGDAVPGRPRVYSFTGWATASATGADLLWRIKDNLRLDPAGELPDGSFLAQVFDSRTDRRRERPVRVRVISYTIEDGRDPAGPYRLITTILDPEQAPAIDLAAAYSQRWEIESAFDELKAHQRGPRAVLRSKSPDLVTREIWGHLCCHYAIRTPMFEAAEHTGHDPDRVSFVAALRIARRSIAQQGAFFPSRG